MNMNTDISHAVLLSIYSFSLSAQCTISYLPSLHSLRTCQYKMSYGNFPNNTPSKLLNVAFLALGPEVMYH